MRILFLVSFVLQCSWSMAQEFKMGVAYTHLYSKQWDKAIQTYNFSRPFVVEKQPLLMHGLNSSLSYIFKSSKNLKQGINVSYSYYRSSAENEKIENTLNLSFLHFGYVLHYEKPEKYKGFYSDLAISVKSSALFRNVHGGPFVYDEATSKAFGIGSDIFLKSGYLLNLKDKMNISPFILIAYTPYLYSPNTEVVINQTKGLTSEKWTGIMSAQIGMAFHVREKLKD
jgi:hypothetical protein